MVNGCVNPIEDLTLSIQAFGIQAYLGYYVASKLRFSTPGPIHRISSWDGCCLAMGCLPLNITNIYFILREWVHQYNGRGRGAIDLVYHGSPFFGTPASVHGSKAVGVACLESMNWVRVTGAGQVYLSHIGGCAHDRVIWLATLLWRGVRDGITVDAYRASNSWVRGALWKALYVLTERKPGPRTQNTMQNCGEQKQSYAAQLLS
jgi:hypothetical protein